MEIFIGNLPLNASVVDLRKLFGKINNGARFRIYKSRQRDGSSKVYGHAVVESETFAFDLMTKYDGSLIRDSRIQVRAYRQRSVNNDRRAPLWTGLPWSGLDRRHTERRRKR